MDRVNEKGATRNRYAKIQPLFNRSNRLQTGNPESNSSSYHCVRRCDGLGVDSYACQLQNHFGNLVLVTNRETKVIKQRVDGQSRSPKIPAASIDQPIFSPGIIIGETVRKQKKSKCRNKERFYCAPLLDFKAELLDILYCILYIMWCPILFFMRLILTVATWPAYALCNVFKLSLRKEEKVIRENDSLRSTENKPLEKQASDINKCPTIPRYDFNISEDFSAVLQKTEGDKSRGVQTEDRKDHKEPQSLRGNSISPVKIVGDAHEESGKYLQYSLRHEDVSSVKLSSDCLSDERSSRLLDSKDQKKKIRHFQDSVSVAGNRHASFKCGRTVADAKRKIDAMKPSRKSELRMKNQELFEVVEFSNKNLETIKLSHATDEQITDLKNELINCYSSMAREERKLNCRKSSADKSEPYAIPQLPLKPTLQKMCIFRAEGKNEDKAEKYDCALGNDLKTSTATSEVPNTDLLQPIVSLSHRTAKGLEFCFDTGRDLSQKTEDVIPFGPNEYNPQCLLSKRDVRSLVTQGKEDLRILKTETLDSKYFKELSEFDGAERKDEPKKQMGMKDSPSLVEAEKDVQQAVEVPKIPEEEKIRIGSGDRPTTNNNGVSKFTEFTNPIDAKSKWLEMKKKFYGKDYAVAVKEPGKPAARNLSQIASSSKLPAHKIFQYNMVVGRARQIGAEPPPPENIFLEQKTTSACLTVLEDGTRWSTSMRKEPQASRSVTPIPRCLSQTRSLSQWPDSNSPFKTRRYSLMEEKPRPKPRTKGGAFSSNTILGNSNAPAIDHLTSACANSSVSSTDVRTAGKYHSGDYRNRMGLKSPHFEQKAIEKLVHLSDEAAEDRGVDNRFASLPIHQVLQSRVTPLDWPLAMKDTEDANLSDQYTAKIDSLISFCGSPLSAPR